MDAEPIKACELRDDKLNEALEAQSAEELDGLSIQNQRLAKIQEYEEAPISRSDPLAAVIGMGNAYLQRIFDHLGVAVLDNMDSRAHSVEELREYGPEIRLMVKLRNAIQTDLAIHDFEAQQQITSIPHRRNDKGLKNNVATRKRDLVPQRSSANH